MLMNYLSYTAAKLTGDTSLKYDHNRHHHSYELVNTHDELLAKALEDKQESVELDPSEVPCLHESDVDVDEDHHQEIKGKKRVEDRNGIGQRSMHEEGSWQMLMKNPRKWREPQSFYDVLSFWKHKEKGNEL